MKSFTVTKNDAGQRLDKFIRKAVPSLPQALMYKYIRTKHIKVNRKRAEISTRLEENDVVELFIKDEFFTEREQYFDFMNAPKSLSIIYEDENILLLDKKAGVLCHPDGREYVDTLINRVKRYLYEKGEYAPENENSFIPSLANRIDRNTGGIVIAAKNAESLRLLNEIIRTRQLHKFYLCVTVGTPPKRSDTLEGYLYKDENSNTVKVSKKPFDGAKSIRTKYSVLDSFDGLSLVEIELLTGRTHQIRAHMASIGCPLLGDGKYGSNRTNKKFGGYKKQLLYSYKLKFNFTEDMGILNYLNGKEFEVSDIWFKEEFYNKGLV